MLKQLCTGLQHIGIPTVNWAESLEFYEQLGFEAALNTVQPNGGSVVFMQLGNLVLEVYEAESADETAGAIDHIAIDVTDIELVFAVITGSGFTALEGEIKYLPFWENGVRYFTITGPNHEKVEYSQRM